MSHSIQKINIGNNALVVVTIIDYAPGGETFTTAELALAGSNLTGGFPLYSPSSVYVPKFVGNTVRLGAPTGNSDWGELPATVGVNFSFTLIALGDSSQQPMIPAYVPVTTTINGQPLTGNITISGGGSSNTAQAIVDFGNLTPQETTASATVAAPWVTASSKLIPSVTAGQDHTADEIAAEQVTASTGNIVPGVSFDVWLSSPNGSSGKFLVNIAGF